MTRVEHLSGAQSPFRELAVVDEGDFRYYNLSDVFEVTVNFVKSGTRVESHRHERDVYNRVLTGAATLTRANKEERYEAGEWLFIPAGEAHALEAHGEVSLLELWRR